MLYLNLYRSVCNTPGKLGGVGYITNFMSDKKADFVALNLRKIPEPFSLWLSRILFL